MDAITTIPDQIFYLIVLVIVAIVYGRKRH